jgi:hypothetical protein
LPNFLTLLQVLDQLLLNFMIIALLVVKPPSILFLFFVPFLFLQVFDLLRPFLLALRGDGLWFVAQGVGCVSGTLLVAMGSEVILDVGFELRVVGSKGESVGEFGGSLGEGEVSGGGSGEQFNQIVNHLVVGLPQIDPELPQGKHARKVLQLGDLHFADHLQAFGDRLLVHFHHVKVLILFLEDLVLLGDLLLLLGLQVLSQL